MFPELGITGYFGYFPHQLWYLGNHNANLSCRVAISIFVALRDHNPPALQTDRQTDRQT